MKNDFNIIAPHYDLLASTVFGKQLERAQCAYLDQIEVGSAIMIVGGGSGKIIGFLPDMHDLEIDYVELSESMLHKAKTRPSKGCQIDFIHRDIREHSGSYDIIVTNFFLDCFSSSELREVLRHLKDQLKVGGKLLVTDFYPNDQSRHRLLLKVMHWFFRATTDLDANELTDIHEQIKSEGFEPLDIQFFRNATLFSAVYGLAD